MNYVENLSQSIFTAAHISTKLWNSLNYYHNKMIYSFIYNTCVQTSFPQFKITTIFLMNCNYSLLNQIMSSLFSFSSAHSTKAQICSTDLKVQVQFLSVTCAFEFVAWMNVRCDLMLGYASGN